jgi:hypothetical protein
LYTKKTMGDDLSISSYIFYRGEIGYLFYLS